MNDFYLEHVNSNCEFSHIFICFRCFTNYDVESIIKHNEDLCLKNYIDSRIEIQEKKLTDINGEINYIYQRIKELDTKIDSNALKINGLNITRYRLEIMINDIKEQLNNFVKFIKSEIQSIDSFYSPKISAASSEIISLINNYNELLDNAKKKREL